MILALVITGILYAVVDFPGLSIHQTQVFNTLDPDEKWMLEDLDGDGESEIVIKSYLQKPGSSVYFKTQDGREFQSNFLAKWLPDFPLYFTDLDKNGVKEAIGFQYENDSLFISAVEFPNTPMLDRKFVATGFSDIESSYFKIGQIERQTGGDRLGISVMGGYGAQPRNLCLLDMSLNEWTTSPDSIQAYFYDFQSFDLDKNGDFEILAWGRSPDNNHGGEFFSDQNAYIMVFNQDLEVEEWYQAKGLLSNTTFFEINEKPYVISNSFEESINGHLVSLASGTDTLLSCEDGYVLRLVGCDQNGCLLEKESKGKFKAWAWFGGNEEVEFVEADPEVEIMLASDVKGGYFMHINSRNGEFGVSTSPYGKITVLPYDPRYAIITTGEWNNRKSVMVSGNLGSELYSIEKSPLVLLNKILPLVGGLLVFFTSGLFLNQKKSPDSNSELLRINTRTGFEIIPLDNILYCMADGRCTKIETTDNGQVLSSQNLGTIEPQIKGDQFTRISRSIIVNKTYLRKVDRKKLKAFFKVPTGIKELDLNAKEVKALKEVF